MVLKGTLSAIIGAVNTGLAGDNIRARFQLEKRPYGTSFCPQFDQGEVLLSGYTWAGAAHASPSTRARSYATVPTAGSVNRERGALLARVRLHYLSSVAQYVFSASDGGANRLDMSIPDGETLRMVYGNPHTLIDASGQIPLGEPTDLYMAWDATGQAGVAIGADPLVMANGTVPAVIGATAFIGEYAGGNLRPLDGAIDQLLLFDRPLSDAERAVLVNAETWRWSSLIPTPGGVMRVGSSGAPFGVMRVGFGEGD